MLRLCKEGAVWPDNCSTADGISRGGRRGVQGVGPVSGAAAEKLDEINDLVKHERDNFLQEVNKLFVRVSLFNPSLTFLKRDSERLWLGVWL